MWPRESVTIEVARSATTPLGFQLWDDVANAPIDITGYTLSCKVASADGEQVIESHAVDITSFVDGEFDIIFDGREYGITGTQERVNLSYQVAADDGSGDPVIVMRGPLILVPGIN